MFEQIKKDLVSSMKEQDKFKTSVLRMLKSALQTESINKNKELNDDEIISVIKKQIKIRTSSLEEYKKYNRDEIAKDLAKEIEILKTYIPEDLSLEELDKIIDEVFTKLNPTSIKEMGKVIKEVGSIVGTRADMSIVSQKVKERLS